MKVYPQHQESQEGWIGEIPSHWPLERIKFSLNEVAKRYDDALSAGAISFGKVVTKDADGIPVETRSTYQVVREGEYLINPINLNYDLRSLRTALSGVNVCVSPAYIVLQANTDKLDPAFGAYALHLFDVRHMKTLGAGVRQTITFRDIGRCFWALPPRDEQIAIAAFLDYETGRIDDLIAEQECLITLLDEKRQAVISHAVTKGLDPDVEMKDSGIEWLGYMPEHWEVVPLKHVATSNDEVLPENTLPEHEIRYIEISDVDSIEGIRSANTYEFNAAPSRARRIVREGDVLASTVRTYLRAIAPVTREYADCIASTGFCVIRAHRCSAQYLGYAIRSKAFISDVISKSTGVSYPAINSTDLMCLKIAVPASNEQKEIATYLDQATRKFDVLSIEARSSISILKERRSALISAAVTGKIDVRNHPTAVAALHENKD